MKKIWVLRSSIIHFTSCYGLCLSNAGVFKVVNIKMLRFIDIHIECDVYRRGFSKATSLCSQMNIFRMLSSPGDAKN